MAREIKISETNPFEDALFLTRAECNKVGVPAHIKMQNVKTIMMALEHTLKNLSEKNPIPLQNWPTGVEE